MEKVEKNNALNLLVSGFGHGNYQYQQDLIAFHLRFAYEEIEREIKALNWLDFIEESIEEHKKKIVLIENLVAEIKRVQ